MLKRAHGINERMRHNRIIEEFDYVILADTESAFVPQLIRFLINLL